MKSIFLAGAVLGAIAFGSAVHARDNVLLIIADDMGVEALGCYGIGRDTAPTPNIDALCKRGVVFESFWSQSTCSPTRATILTGRYGFRTGVGGPSGGSNPGIGLSEPSIFKLLKAHAGERYDSAVIGKWHLSDQRNGGDDNPARMGVPHYAGFMRGGLRDYFSWQKVVNGRTERVDRYATTEFVDDALRWLEPRKGKPWFLWLAMTAPHTPFHKPPEKLLADEFKSLPDRPSGRDASGHYKAMINAMDTEIGRLLKGIGDRELAKTNVIFIGDNGSPARVAGAPFTRRTAKDTLYEGGVRVPLVVAGPAVNGGGRTSKALVNSTDLFATILEMAGVDARGAVAAEIVLDSVSFLPVLESTAAEGSREFIFSDKFGERRRRGLRARNRQDGGAQAGARGPRANAGGGRRGGRPVSKHGQAIRDDSYKLIRFTDGSEEFYDLRRDPFERRNLTAPGLSDEAAEHRRALLKHLSRLTASR